MARLYLPFVSVLLLVCLTNGAVRSGTKDGSEEWGYVQVRPKAHMFWWLYRSPYRVEDSSKPWPIILWLQGGPGASGTAIGNFQEVGPLDTDLKKRNSTWMRVADLLFVDNPVGAGYSFVEDKELLVQTDEEAANDFTTLLKKLFNRNKNLQNRSLYIVAESYGGKFAVTIALAALRAISSGSLKLHLGGVALGNSWISPEDYVLSWGPLLKDVSRLDTNGAEEAYSLATKIKQQITDSQFMEAFISWSTLENLIIGSSNAVDFYNFLLDSAMDPTSPTLADISEGVAIRGYSRYLTSIQSSSDGHDPLSDFMNGPIKKKLSIIPPNVEWGGQENDVFDALGSDFMRPRIKEVDELLAKGVNVTVYSGQLDVICSTKGTQAWMEKLKWEGLHGFRNADRNPLYCGNGSTTKGFTKSFQNLHFYWILNAGHFVPVDQPCTALKMVGLITQSPAASCSEPRFTLKQ